MRLLLSALALSWFAPSAMATVVTVRADGNVLDVDNDTGFLPFVPSVGDPMSIIRLRSDQGPRRFCCLAVRS